MNLENRKIMMRWAVRIILIALIVFWMIIIFGFSSDNGEQSQSLSDRITVKVVHVLNPDFEDLSVAKQQEYFYRISFFVRKTGHFGEYGILGFLWFALLITFDNIKKIHRQGFIPLVLSTGICIIYAVSDEIHQGFVVGRTPKFLDIVIDTLGGLAGAAFLLFLWLVIRRRKHESLGK